MGAAGLDAASLERASELLARLVAGDVPLSPALDDLARDLTGPLREATRALAHEIEAGRPLSAAMADGGRFPPLFVALVAAGERAGGVAPILGALARHAAARSSARRRLMHHVAYPLIVGVLAIAMFAYTAIGFAAESRRLSDRVGLERARSTAAHRDMRAAPIAEGALLGGAVLSLLALAVAIATGRVPELAYRAPLVGVALRRAETALLVRAFSLLVGAGEAPERALRLAAEACAWRRLRGGAVAAATALDAGEPFARALARVDALSLELRGVLVGAAQRGADFAHAADRAAAQAEADALDAARGAATGLEVLFTVLAGATVLACGIATYDGLARLVEHLARLE